MWRICRKILAKPQTLENMAKWFIFILFYKFNIPAGYNIRFLQRTKASPLELARKRFPRPTKNELSEALTNSLSFLIVREPFERLLSAYRNKLEGYRNKYYKLLGEQIVKKYRKGSKKVSTICLEPGCTE